MKRLLRRLWLFKHRLLWEHSWQHYANAMKCTDCGEIVVFRMQSR